MNAGNKNTPSTHHPRRRNVTTLMVGLKKRSHTQKSHPKVVNPTDIAGEPPKKKGPGTSGSTLSLFENVCGCHIFAAVYIKLCFSFSKSHPCQNLSHTKLTQKSGSPPDRKTSLLRHTPSNHRNDSAVLFSTTMGKEAYNHRTIDGRKQIYTKVVQRLQVEFAFRGFPTRTVHLHYISCLTYTILVGNHPYTGYDYPMSGPE